MLAYAIYATQQDGKTEFRKHEFQEKFEYVILYLMISKTKLTEGY